MKKSVITFACLTLAAFTFFSCASKETDIPENLLQELSEPETTETVPEDISEDSENEAQTDSDITFENYEEKAEPSENLSSLEENAEETNIYDELDEIIEPEVFEAELPPEEPEIIPADEEEKAEESSEPLTEEETTEIEELPEVITEEAGSETEKTEADADKNDSDSKNTYDTQNDVDEVIEISDDKADEVESLEEASTDEENKVSEETEEEAEIIPSRSVTLKKGETLDVSYPGKGWIFLGATDGSKNLTSTGRKTNAKSTDFSLMARVSGTVILHFYKEDILADKYIDDYLEVTVQDIKSKSTVHVKAPSYAETVPPKPAAKKEENLEPATPAPKAETVKSVEKPVTNPEPAIKPVQPAPVAEVMTSSEKTVLSAEDYLSRAKKASDEKNYTEMYNNLQNFLLITDKNRDEGLFLMAQLYEGNSEYRNIKKSVETYEELTANYPLSKYWDDANKRAIYLKRFYINIR